MHGGKQERGIRSGTLNVPGIVGLGEAANLNLALGALRGDTVIHSLPDLALSGGAACSSGKAGASHVLAAMGLSPDEARGARYASASAE